jgi:hypothetical protein
MWKWHLSCFLLSRPKTLTTSLKLGERSICLPGRLPIAQRCNCENNTHDREIVRILHGAIIDLVDEINQPRRTTG